MKKLLLTAAVICGFAFSQAQDTGFNGGAHFGLPLGDVKDAFSMNIGLDASYLFEVSDQFKAGFGTGYDLWLGKTETISLLGSTFEFENENASFIPVYGTAKYNLSENFFLGANLGYAIGVSEGNDGGFLYEPKVGATFNQFDVYGFYKGISMDGGSFSSVGLGFNYAF